MIYHDKLQKYFSDRNISNLEISKLTGYSPSMVSRYLKKSTPNFDFIIAFSKAFPDIDWNYLFKEVNNNIEEEKAPYIKNPDKIIKEIEIKLKSLKFNLAQNSHK